MALPLYHEAVELIARLCVGGASLGCIYLLIASFAVLRFPKRRRPPPARPMPVTVLRPLHGFEPGLSERLCSFRSQRYGAPVQLVCGVADADDAATDAVVEAGENHSGIIDLIVDAHQHGRNRKISNLINMVPLARHEVLVVSDSDIEIGPGYLAKIMAELQRPGVGAVTCLFHGVAAGSSWAHHSALAINSHFLPNVVMAVSFGLAQPCFGSTIAMRRETLSRLGGFKSFADCLADDYAIGEAVRSTGAGVTVTSFSLGHVCFEDSLHAVFSHELRVARTIRSIDPIGYFGTFITHPFPLALLGALLGGQDAAALAAIALVCRGALTLCVEYAFGLARQPYWLLPGRDILSFAVYIASFFGTTVIWRGICHRVNADGRLMPIEMGKDHDADTVSPGSRL